MLVARKSLVHVGILFIGTFAMTGCRTFFQPVPIVDRTGELYCYTRYYQSRWLRFNLVGKSICCGKGGNGEWGVPSPGKLLLAVPLAVLYGVENYVACPIVDTAMMPYDGLLILRNKYKCANYGVWVRVTDADGKPVSGSPVTIMVHPSYENGNAFLYDGEVIRSGDYKVSGRTDDDGLRYVPVCIEEGFLARLSIGESNDKDGFHDILLDSNGWHEERIRFGHHNWHDSPDNMLQIGKLFLGCPRCGMGMGNGWTSDGACKSCGKPLHKRGQVMRMWRLMNTGLSLCKDEDFEKASQISGVDKNMLKRYFGYDEKLERANKVIAVRKLNITQMPLSIKNEARLLPENTARSAPNGKGEKDPIK